MTALFAALLCAEATGTVTFVVILATLSGWRSTRVGRHLMLYGCALTSVYVGTLARGLWRSPVSLAVLLVAHVAFALACWHRVYVVLREQRDGPQA